VVRKRNEAHGKQVPIYLIVAILFFIYDDIWFSYDQHPVMHVLMLLLIGTVALLYAVGQGPVMRQIADILYEKLLSVVGAGKAKVEELRGGKKK
jgi:hypothetical protein